MRALVMLAFVAVPSAVLGLSTPSATANPADPNGQILFGRYDPNLDDTVLYTINPDGSHDRQVVPFAVECPHWSPDGSRIAACGTHSFGESSGATIIDPDTGSYRELPGARGTRAGHRLLRVVTGREAPRLRELERQRPEP